MSFRLLSYRDGPECRNEWSAMLIYANGMQAEFNVLAKTRIVKAEGEKREVSAAAANPKPAGIP